MVLTDWSLVPPGERNILRRVFLDPRVRAVQHDWEGLARFVVAAFRADAVRAGAIGEVAQMVEELCRASPAFAALWRAQDVAHHGEGVKRLNHPALGPTELEYASFAVDGRPDLGLIVYNPVEPGLAERIRGLVEAAPVTPCHILSRCQVETAISVTSGMCCAVNLRDRSRAACGGE